MREAVVVAACRTAVGRAPRGTLKDTRPEDMGCAVLGDLLKRANDLDPKFIDDVILGCTFPEATQGLNLGRVLVMSMGWPDRIPGMTVNRFCHGRIRRCSGRSRRGEHESDPHRGEHDVSQSRTGGHKAGCIYAYGIDR